MSCAHIGLTAKIASVAKIMAASSPRIGAARHRVIFYESIVAPSPGHRRKRRASARRHGKRPTAIGGVIVMPINSCARRGAARRPVCDKNSKWHQCVSAREVAYGMACSLHPEMLMACAPLLRGKKLKRATRAAARPASSMPHGAASARSMPALASAQAVRGSTSRAVSSAAWHGCAHHGDGGVPQWLAGEASGGD